MPKYVIEHLDGKIGRWSLIEYKNISKMIGKSNLWFTNIKKKNKSLKKIGRVFKERFSEIQIKEKINQKEVCVLDPESNKILTTKESKNFKYYIFGGILGDYPPRKRTKKELSNFIKAEKRNIGKKQFSTDNAVYVTSEIVKGKDFKKMNFIYKPRIKMNEFLSLDLPFLYPEENNNPKMSPELMKFLKRKKGF